MAITANVKALALALFTTQVSWADGAAIAPRSDVPPGYVAASYYPAPYGGWTPEWADSYEKAKAMVDRMTLAEKTNITSGTGIFMGMNSCVFVCLPGNPLLTSSQGTL